jgi:hypothetical protein
MALSIAILNICDWSRMAPSYPPLSEENTKKRPENGSGRKVVGQIRGGITDVNAALFCWNTPNSATFSLI